MLLIEVIAIHIFFSNMSVHSPHSTQCIRSDQISRSVMSDSLRPHESQHARPPCSSPTPGVHSDSHPLSQWCHPAISSSVVPFSSCPQSLPASGSFPMSQLFAWGGQSIAVSALTSVLPMNTQELSPLEWTGWISLQSKGLSRVLLQHHSSKASILQRSAFFTIQLSHPYTLSTFYSWEHSMMSPNIKLTPSLFGKLTLTHFVRLHLRPHFLWEVFPGLLSFVGCSLTLSFVPNITLISVNVGSNWFVTRDLSCSHTD